jgi:hypothetical protein
MDGWSKRFFLKTLLAHLTHGQRKELNSKLHIWLSKELITKLNSKLYT